MHYYLASSYSKFSQTFKIFNNKMYEIFNQNITNWRYWSEIHNEEFLHIQSRKNSKNFPQTNHNTRHDLTPRDPISRLLIKHRITN